MQGLVLTISQLLQRTTADLVADLKNRFPEAEAAQIRSWVVLIDELKNSPRLVSLPENCVIALEYSLPTDGMAIDLLITGLDSLGKKTACLVESKQWGDSFIADSQFSAYREPGKELHPQIQITRHQCSFSNYLDIGPQFNTHPYVYTPNASDAAVRSLITRNPWPSCQNIPVINGMDKLLQHVGQIIVRGDPSVAQQLQDAQFSPSREIIDAMGAIVTKEEPFLLTPEQETAAAQIRARIASGSRIIRITGAAGAGKTAILLNLYLQYLNEAHSTNVFPILVCGAQNTAFYRSTYPQVRSSFGYSYSVPNTIKQARSRRCIVFMDEAQHNQPGVLTQIADLGATLVLCYDVAQVINADNAIAELHQLEHRPDFLSIALEGSVRYNSSPVAEKNIRTFLRGGTQFQPDPLFEFQPFYDFSSFQDKIFDTISQHPDRTLAITGLLCGDAINYTNAGNPNSRLFTKWGDKMECEWMPYVRNRNYLSQYGGNLWVGTWWQPGLDCDYTAVIAGGDAVITSNGVVAVPEQFKLYRMMTSVAHKLQLPQELFTDKPYKSCQQINAYLARPENEALRARFIHSLSPYVRNLYYIMMSRGRRGCFVYFSKNQNRP